MSQQAQVKGWRLGGVIAFAGFAVLELGDWIGLVPGYGDPAAYAEALGISPAAASARLIVLSSLAWGIVAAAAAAALGLFRRRRWADWAAQLTGAIFIAHGMYQIVSALAQAGRNQPSLVGAGIVYVLLGVAAVAVGRRASGAE